MLLLLDWVQETAARFKTEIEQVSAVVTRVNDSKFMYSINDNGNMTEGERASLSLAQIAVEQYILK